MDVITISGLQFRVKPDVTIRHVLDVFRSFGKVGVIVRDGVVEYLDSPVNFAMSNSYEFVDAIDLFSMDNKTGSLPFRRTLNTTPEELLKNRVELPDYLVENPMYQTATTMLNQRAQQQRLLNQRALLLNEELPLIADSNSGILQPKFYQHVYLKARDEDLLKLDKIEMFNMNEEIVEMKPAIESNGILVGNDAGTRSALQPVYALTGAQLRLFGTSLPGSWMRLGLNDNRNDSISTVVLRGIHSLNGSRFELRKVNEYSIAFDSKSFKYLNSHQTDMINVIEIRAPADRVLQMKQIMITTTQNNPVVDFMKFETSDLYGTRNDMTAQQLLFQSTNNDDYIQSVSHGGFIRMTLANPMSIKAIHLLGELRDVKVTMERQHSHTCSAINVESFAL